MKLSEMWKTDKRRFFDKLQLEIIGWSLLVFIIMIGIMSTFGNEIINLIHLK